MKKTLGRIGIGMLSLLLGVPAAVWAQDEPKPPRQEEPKAEPRHQDEAKPQRQDEAKPPKHEEPRHTGRDTKTEGARQQERPEQSSARPAGGPRGHVPDDKFRAHFGRQHTVVIRQPVIVEGQPRFQYAGYWFVISDPWPEDWSYADDCYIDYVDGDYFLFDLLHPGVRVVLFVVM